MARNNRLAALMATQGINQSELSLMTGIQRHRINEYFNNKGTPNLRNAIRIARALGASVEDIWDAEERSVYRK